MKKIVSWLTLSALTLGVVGDGLALGAVPLSHEIQVEMATGSAGKCGEDAYYTYDSNTGHLSITGTGEVEGGNFVVLGIVETLSLAPGITSIGDYAFYFLAAVEEISIPHTVTDIGQGAFAECRSLQSLFLPRSLVEMKSNALAGVPATIYAFADSYGGVVAEESGLYTWVKEVPEWAQYNNPVVEISPWASPFVDYVAEEIMPDISSYNYKETSSRGLIAQSMYNMCGQGETGLSLLGLTDLGVYREAIAWCQHYGIMEGYSANTFGTEQPVTREQFALILQKTAEVLGKPSLFWDNSSLEGYDDQETISSWARNAMAWAVTQGLMEGNDNLLHPTGEISRVEVAVMLYQFNQL